MDFSMSLGDFVTAGVVIAGALTAYGAMRGTVNALVKSFGELSTRTEAQFDDVKMELKKLGDVMIVLAETKGRMDRMDDRAILQGGRIDESSKQITVLKDEISEIKILLAGLKRST